MFLLVVDIDKPVINDVLEQVTAIMTTGADDKSYRGEYIDPEWVNNWSTLPQEMSLSRINKIQQLDLDRDTFVAAGYNVGPFKFPLTEHFFRLLADRLRWLGDAIATLKVPANTSLTFSDLEDAEVTVV